MNLFSPALSYIVGGMCGITALACIFEVVDYAEDSRLRTLNSQIVVVVLGITIGVAGAIEIVLLKSAPKANDGISLVPKVELIILGAILLLGVFMFHFCDDALDGIDSDEDHEHARPFQQLLALCTITLGFFGLSLVHSLF